MNLPGNYRKGDGVFSVYGNGGGWRIGDHKEDQGPNQGVYMYTADDFDKVMSEKSKAYKKILEENKPFTLILYACLSAYEYTEKDVSMARKISKKHPQAIIIGFDGYAMYGTKDGKPAVVGSSKDLTYNDNKGFIVTFKNGKEINRQSFADFLKTKK